MCAVLSLFAAPSFLFRVNRVQKALWVLKLADPRVKVWKRVSGETVVRPCLILSVSYWDESHDPGLAAMFSIQTSGYEVIRTGILLKLINHLFQQFDPVDMRFLLGKLTLFNIKYEPLVLFNHLITVGYSSPVYR